MILVKNTNLHSISFNSSQSDAKNFRSDFITYYSNKYESRLASSIDTLKSVCFENDLLNSAHTSELRYGLLFRHALPFLATEDDLFGGSNIDSSITLTGCLAIHSLSLTHLDYHLDGATPRDDSDSTAIELDYETAISYAIRMILKAGSIISNSSVSDRIWKDCIDPISGFVMSRMFLDWKERYKLEFLNEKIERRITYYEDDTNTRMHASGYWELMIRAAFVVHSRDEFPDMLLAYCKSIRRIRQLIDELQDIEEDIVSGLITFPVLYLMQDSPSVTKVLIKQIWKLSKGIEMAHLVNNENAHKLAGLVSELKSVFYSSPARERYHLRIQDEYRKLIDICDELKAPNLKNIVDFKIAKFILLRT